MGVTSKESDNMKLFLVLVLATVAMCHPKGKKAAPVAVTYKHVENEDGRIVPARSFKEEKLPPQPYRKKRFAGGSRGDHVAAPQPPPQPDVTWYPGTVPQRVAVRPRPQLPY